MEMMNMFKIVILIMLLYSFGITIISYTIGEADTATGNDALNYISSFNDVSSEMDLESVSTDIQDSVQKQTNIPVIEIGALVFYSGNILIDLILNFAYAIPQMIGLLVHGIQILLNVDNYIFAVVELFAAVVVTVLYFIGIIQLLLSVRSGRTFT